MASLQTSGPWASQPSRYVNVPPILGPLLHAQRMLHSAGIEPYLHPYWLTKDMKDLLK